MRTTDPNSPVSYVYLLFRPNGVPCYIGKGRGRRWVVHEEDGAHNKRLARIMKNAGGSLPRMKLREGLTDAEAQAAEIDLIRTFGRAPRGPLVNLTDGGDGSAGYRHTDDAKRRIAAAMTGREISAETREKFRQNSLRQAKNTHTAETRAKISAGNRGKKQTASAKAKISAAKLGHPVSDATRAKIRASLLKRNASK